MGWLKEWFDGILDAMAAFGSAMKIALTNFKYYGGPKYYTKTGLDHWWSALPKEEQEKAEVKASFDAAYKDLEGGGMFGELPNALYEGFVGLKEKIEGSIGDVVSDALKPGSPELKHIFEDASDLLLDSIFDIINPEKDKIPEEVRKAYKDTMAPILGLGLTFTVGTSLAELIHPTKNMGLGHISHFLYDTVGFKNLMDAYIEPIRTNIIKQPTKYAMNALTTPFLPRWADAVEWFGRGHIDEDEMLDLMRQHGVQTDYLWLYARMGTKPSSYFMLNAIGKEGLYDEEDFKFWLSDAGYGAFQITDATMSTYEKKYGLKPPSTTQIDFLAAAYKRMAERMEWAGMVPLAKKAVREGLRDVPFFREQLGLTYRKKEVDDLEVALLEGDIQEEVDREYRKAYEKKYLAGRIEKDELEAKLIEHGLRPERANARVTYFVERKLGKLATEGDEKVLSDSRVLNSYKYGLKEQGWAIKELDDRGYTLGDAELLVAGVNRKFESDTAKEWVRVYEQRMKYNVITVDELKNEYIALGKAEEWAEARATYAYEKALGAPEEIVEDGAEKIKANILKEWIRVYEQRARYGELTQDELESAYIELGKAEEWSRTRATYIFERLEEVEEVTEVKEVEKTKADITKEWIRLLEQRAKYGMITEGNLVAEYITTGKDDEWAKTRARRIFEKP